MILSVDVLATQHRRDTRKLLREARRVTPPGGQIIEAHYTNKGNRVHAPWAPLSGLRRIPWFRDDGWGMGPHLRRALVLAAWKDRESLDAFQAGNPWPADAERWHVRLKPVRSHGTIRGEDPLGELAQSQGTGDEVGIVISLAASVPHHKLGPFYKHLKSAADAQHLSPGALASFATTNPRLEGFTGLTVSCWRELNDAVAYAYRGDAHKAAVSWYESQSDLGEQWIVRCVLEASSGTVAGRDPFRGLVSTPREGAQKAAA